MSANRTVSTRLSQIPCSIAFVLFGFVLSSVAVGQESAAQRRNRHAPIERLGHGYVYDITANLTPPETQEQLLNRPPKRHFNHKEGIETLEWDPSQETRAAIRKMNADGFTLVESIDGKNDFQAIVVKDSKGQTYIAFRGTEGAQDLADDVGRIGIWQYENNKSRLDQLAEDYPGAIVTGHSLGAALAQRYTADHPERVKEMVLFQAPGVDKATVEKYRAKTSGPFGVPPVPGQIYNAEGDYVGEHGGDEFLDSNVSIAYSDTGDLDRGYFNSLKFKPHRATLLQSDSDASFVELDSETYNRNRGKNNISGFDSHLSNFQRLPSLPGAAGAASVAKVIRMYYQMPTYQEWQQIAAADQRITDQQLEKILAELQNDGLTDGDQTKGDSSQQAAGSGQDDRAGMQRFERRKVPRLPGWND